MFRVLKNVLVNQKIRSRHFYLYLVSRVLPKVFIITPQAVGNDSFAQTAFFWKYFKRGMILLSICQYLLPFLHFYNFCKIFPYPTQVPAYFIGWGNSFWEFLQLYFHFHKLHFENHFSGVPVPSPKAREFQKHKVSHVTTFPLNLLNSPSSYLISKSKWLWMTVKKSRS